MRRLAQRIGLQLRQLCGLGGLLAGAQLPGGAVDLGQPRALVLLRRLASVFLAAMSLVLVARGVGV